MSHHCFTLPNGLRVVVLPQKDCPLVTVNVMYHVGSRNEDPEATGRAHFFEHLMFGPSKEVAAYDEVLHSVGGTNNAYTSADVTNYYCMLPAAEVETAFRLEASRMRGLLHDPKFFEVQRKVVMEEFKQTSLDKVYGCIWHLLLGLAYTKHPYRYPTIGKELDHIAQATIPQIKAFEATYYHPSNAVLVVAGGITKAQVATGCAKWFAPIAAGKVPSCALPQEPIQQEARKLTVHREVPLDAIYKAYPMPAVTAKGYLPLSLFAPLIGYGKAAPLYQELVVAQQLFTDIAAYTLDSLDPGLLIVSGRLQTGVTLAAADEALTKLLTHLASEGVDAQRLQRAKNQYTTCHYIAQASLASKAEELAMGTILGAPTFYEAQMQEIAKLEGSELQEAAKATLLPHRSNTVWYKKKGTCP